MEITKEMKLAVHMGMRAGIKMAVAGLEAAKRDPRGEGDAVTGECRPPEGTPDGTVCYLTNGAVDLPYVWRKRAWHSTYILGRKDAPSALKRRGWRFHSIATPPSEATPE